jgi:hypothetical protein
MLAHRVKVILTRRGTIKGNSEGSFLEVEFSIGTLFRILSIKENWRVRRQQRRILR